MLVAVQVEHHSTREGQLEENSNSGFSLSKSQTLDLLLTGKHGIGSHILLVPVPLVKGLAPIQLSLWRLTLPLVMMNHGAGGGVPQTFTGQGDTNEVDNHSHILDRI